MTVFVIVDLIVVPSPFGIVAKLFEREGGQRPHSGAILADGMALRFQRVQ
jgi:hypothetical protein